MQSQAANAELCKDALGIGLRPVHMPHIFEHWPELGYFEIITENFLGSAEGPSRNLARVQSRYPLVLHGVGLNLLGHEGLDLHYLDQVRRLADRVGAAFVTDHLCWTGAGGLNHHDLLPTPYTRDVLDLAVERAAFVQRRLERPFGLENLSSYVDFHASTMPEWEFYTRVVEQAGCWFMLDINNIYVSSVNHGFDPYQYLSAIDFSRVLQVHLAGHSQEPDGTLIDTHDRPVRAEVWQLYAHAWRIGGPFPTLLEWDANIPAMDIVLAELDKARAFRT